MFFTSVGRFMLYEVHAVTKWSDIHPSTSKSWQAHECLTCPLTTARWANMMTS